jgi:hypothetical protein
MVFGYDSSLAAISIGPTEGHLAVHREYLLLPWMFMIATILFGQASGNPEERGTENELERIDDLPAWGGEGRVLALQFPLRDWSGDEAVVEFLGFERRVEPQLICEQLRVAAVVG